MKIERIVVGKLEENCYIGTINDKSFIVDPGDEADRIIDACKDKNIVEILVTHNHFDHIGALDKLEKYYNLKANKKSNYFNYEVINTPGHTVDSKTFYFKDDNIMFTGDFIFFESIGRMDLDTGNPLEMINSLNLISNYSDDIIIYPGHGPHSTLGHEKERFKFYF